MNAESLLIVEDISEAMASLIRVAQSAFPEARIDTAKSLKEARLLIVQRQWSMALIDIGLPDGSGLDLVRLFSELSPDTVCVVSTVLGDDTHIVAALSAGAQGYILKGQPEPVLLRHLGDGESGVGLALEHRQAKVGFVQRRPRQDVQSIHFDARPGQ